MTGLEQRTIDVLIADDDASTRLGIRLALQERGFAISAEATEASEAAEAARRLQPDLCLLDASLPGGGIVAAAAIRDASPETAVVIITAWRREKDLADALRAGAVGYLVKDIDPDRLEHVLRGVLAGDAVVPRSGLARIVERMPPPGGTAALTRREWEVMDLLGQGSSTAEMAAELNLSPVTVRRHLSGCLRKLGAADRQAALRILDRRWPQRSAQTRAGGEHRGLHAVVDSQLGEDR